MKSLMLVFVCWLGANLVAPTIAIAGEKLTTANVNMRTGAGVDHGRIATLRRGTLVRVGDCRDGWCQITALGQTGWVLLHDISSSPIYQTVVQSNDSDRRSFVPPPAVKFDLVVPRSYHDLGTTRHHEPLRKFHE